MPVGRRTERWHTRNEASIDGDGDMSEYFQEAGTQVEENDLLPYTAQTGVAQTPRVSYTQVFGTARLPTEPQYTFVLPSLQSALGNRTTVTESATRSYRNTVMTTTTASTSPFLGDGERIRNFFTRRPRSNGLRTWSSSSSRLSPPTFTRNISSRSPSKTVSNNPHRARFTLADDRYRPSGRLCYSRFGDRMPLELEDRPSARLPLASNRPLMQSSQSVVSSTQQNATISTTPNCQSSMSYVVSSTSRETCRQSTLSSRPDFHLTRLSVKSDFGNASDAVLTSNTRTSNCSQTCPPSSELPRAPIKTSEKFPHKVSCDTATTVQSRHDRHPNKSKHTTSDVPLSQEFDRLLEKHPRLQYSRPTEESTSRESRTHEPHPLQLTKQERPRNESHGFTYTSENPLTRRRVRSAPSVCQEYFGRLYKRALLTNSSPEQVDVSLPRKKKRVETRQAAVQTEETENQQHVVGNRRRRSSAGPGKHRGERKMVAFEDHRDDTEPRLRDRLHQRIWDGTSFRVEEVDDINFAETELSRRGSRRDSMGVVYNFGHSVSLKWRRPSTSVYSRRRSVVRENESSQAGSSASAGEPSHAQNEANSNRAESECCAGTSSGKQNSDDDTERNTTFFTVERDKIEENRKPT